MENLLILDAQLRTQLVGLEIQRTNLELENFDFNSKDSNTKQQQVLMFKSPEYKKLVEDIKLLEVEVDTNHRLLSTTRELVNKGLLPSFDAVSSFISSCSSCSFVGK
jgi:hypothetical protein